MSLREEENPVDASCPNQPNSRSKRRRRRSMKKVKVVKHYSSDHQKLLLGDGELTSLREEENPNQPNSSKRKIRRRRKRGGKKVTWLMPYSSNHDQLVMEEENSGAKCPNQPISDTTRRRRSGKKVKWLKHYSSDHRILLVGEGDFSFSLSLGLAFGDASNIVATSLDSHDTVMKKYKGAKRNLDVLYSLGAQVLHGVDAFKMMLHRDLHMQKFDRIIYNFPHAGFLGLETNQRVVKIHRNLISGFFKNASGMLCPEGEVHVAHKTSHPYQSWNIVELATQNSLTLLECIKFRLEDYPGYNNKRGDGKRSDQPFHLGECSTYKFVLSSKAKKPTTLCQRSPHQPQEVSSQTLQIISIVKNPAPVMNRCKAKRRADPLNDYTYLLTELQHLSKQKQVS